MYLCDMGHEIVNDVARCLCVVVGGILCMWQHKRWHFKYM